MTSYLDLLKLRAQFKCFGARAATLYEELWVQSREWVDTFWPETRALRRL